MRILTIVVASIAVLGGTAVTADCPPCGPDLCLNDPRYPKALTAKKAKMKADGFPADLIALMDRDGPCVMRVDRAPDGFTILSVTSNGNSTISWDEDQERVAQKQLLDGTTIAYYKFNVRQRFACCGETAAAQRPDWDAQLQLSRSLAIKCVKSGNNVDCK